MIWTVCKASVEKLRSGLERSPFSQVETSRQRSLAASETSLHRDLSAETPPALANRRRSPGARCTAACAPLVDSKRLTDSARLRPLRLVASKNYGKGGAPRFSWPAPLHPFS